MRSRLSTVLLVSLVVLVLLMTLGSALLKFASDDVYTAVDQGLGRSQIGIVVSGYLTSDVPPTDLTALRARAFELAYRAERAREAASVLALAGLIVALLSGAPLSGIGRGRAASTPVANTTSNGKT